MLGPLVPEHLAEEQEEGEDQEAVEGQEAVEDQEAVAAVAVEVAAEVAVVREVVASPHYARVLQRQEAAHLKEASGHTHVMQDSQDFLQRASVHPAPGWVLVQAVLLLSIVALPQHARMPQLQEPAYLKEVSGHIRVMQDSRDLPRQVPVHPAPGVLLAQPVFLREAVVAPQHV